MSLYNEIDYKMVIQKKIEENSLARGYKTQLALAAGCQKSFLSQVLHSHIHLTPDHAMGLTVFWGLLPDERDYFLELVQKDRASSRSLKELSASRLQEIRRRNQDLATRFQKTKPIEEAQQALYYSSWHWSAIHIMLTIPVFSYSHAIASRLLLPEAFVIQCLENLQQMRLVVKQGKKWRVTQNDIHLPQDSPLTAMNHGNWRNRAVADAQMRSPGNVHYTALHSLSRKDFDVIKGILLSALDKSRQIVKPSSEEELACICVDWFSV